MQSGVTNEKIEVDLGLSVIKSLHATWLVSLYNHLNGCEGKHHIPKGWEKANIALVANGKMQLLPDDPFEDSIPITLWWECNVCAIIWGETKSGGQV